MTFIRRCTTMFILLLICQCVGCTCLMPPKYEKDTPETTTPILTSKEQRQVKSWKHVLDDKDEFNTFEKDLIALQKKKEHQEVVDQVELYFQFYPVNSLSLFDASQRLRYASIIMRYTDSLFALNQVEEAGQALQQARSIVPFNPQIRLQTRKLVRIYRRDKLFGKYHPYFKKLQEPNPEYMDLMQQAREKFTVLPPSHNLFSEDSVSLGQWRSNFFTRNYGTALFWAAPYDTNKIPIILVHGVNGSPKNFEDILPRLRNTPYQPAYFYYPSGMPLKEASKALGQALKDMAAHENVEQFAVIAHSMGGLVTKGVFDQIDVTTELPAWRVFISISSPWTGFEAAEKIESLPDHPPALLDMSPRSEFIRNIHTTPIPESIRFYMLFGAKGSENCFAEGNNDGVIPVSSIMESPVTDMAVDVYGFYETHTSILESLPALRCINGILVEEFNISPDFIFPTVLIRDAPKTNNTTP